MFDLIIPEGRCRKDAVTKFILYTLQDDSGRTIEELAKSPIPDKIKNEWRARKLHTSLVLESPSKDELSYIVNKLEKEGVILDRGGIYYIDRFWG